MAPDLFILAMDHRDSLAKKVYGIEAEPTAVDAERIADGKRVVFRGLLAALDRGADPSVTGVLVDERYGTAVANEARAAGLALAMPIERSGQEWFTLEYGNVGDDSWVEHIQRFAPDYVKVLVRDNPDFDSGCRAKQQEDLAVVSRRLHEMRWPFLFELLVPPTDAQRDTAGSHYDADLRPGLTQTVIHDFQRAGVEPDVWKIEGLEDAEAARAVVAAAQCDGRRNVRCIVLGRDAPTDRLDHWLSVAAGVTGFTGFAIGRSIWERPLVDHMDGRIGESAVVGQVADRYRHFVSVYQKAAGTVG
jgi:myo-inositol catabolism protein IolC